MIYGKIWCVVKPTVGIPLFLGSVALTSLFVHYHLLARGALDVVIESDVNILDVAALAVIVREAGGTFLELSRGERRYNQADVLLRPLLAAGPTRLVEEFRRRTCKV